MITAAAERHSESLFLVRMSFVELYNNRFRNLLERAEAIAAPASSGGWTSVESRSGKIEIRETKVAGVVLTGPGLRFPVTSAAEVGAQQCVSKND